MLKEFLVERLIDILREAGVDLMVRCRTRPCCFDLALRLGDDLILIKALSNIDGLRETMANGIKLLAFHLKGSALIVGEKTRDNLLASGVVYLRHGIPTVNLTTLKEYLVDGIPPLVYAAHGGLYVRIEGGLLREIRLKRNISIGELAAVMGVSRRTVSKYEEDEMNVSVDVVERLEDFINEPVATAIELLKPPEFFKITFEYDRFSESYAEVLNHIMDIGFDVVQTARTPFEAISKRKDRITILTGISDHLATALKKAEMMSCISSVVDAHSLCIVDEIKKRESIGDTVLICKKDFEKIDDANDLTEYLSSVKT